MISHYIPSMEGEGDERNDSEKDLTQVRYDLFNKMPFDEVEMKTFIKVRYRSRVNPDPVAFKK